MLMQLTITVSKGLRSEARQLSYVPAVRMLCHRLPHMRYGNKNSFEKALASMAIHRNWPVPRGTAELPTRDRLGEIQLFKTQAHSLFSFCNMLCGVWGFLGKKDVLLFFFFFFTYMATVTPPLKNKKIKWHRNGTFGKIILVTSSILEYAVQHIWLKYT